MKGLIVILVPYETSKSYGRGDGNLIVRACPELLVQSGHQEKQEGHKGLLNVPNRCLVVCCTASMDSLETDLVGIYWIHFSWEILLTPS